MQSNDDGDGFVIKVTSVLFATCIWPFVVSFFGRHWNEKMAFALAYSVILVVSGWIFLVFALRIAGFVHSALMLGIAGFFFYVWSDDLNAPLADNPAAGIIAAVTLVYFIVGALAAFLGIGTAYLLIGKSSRNGH